MNTKTSILMAKARRPLGCGVRKFGILLTVMAAAIIALPNTVTNDVVVATSDAELRISDRGLGLGLEVVGGGAAEVKLEARPGWRFRDGSTSVTLNKAAGEPAKSPDAVGEGQSAEGSATIVIEDGEDDDDENGDGEGSVEHEKPILSMTATAPKVVAYSVQDGGTNVSISLSATVTTNGKHRKLDAEGNVVEEKEFSPKHYVWKMTGVATGEAETDSSTHTFTVNLTKGESKWLNFSVVGKTCSICDGEVESDAATDSVEIDVYELSISRPDYLGLDRTDAGRQGHVVKTATLSSDPSLPSSSSVEWTECGICEFVGARDQLKVSYQNKDSDTASESYLAERLAASVKLAGMDSAFVCSTNFTVVKVDIKNHKECVTYLSSDVVIGERMQLEGVLSPPSAHVDLYTWGIPGEIIQDWQASDKESKIVNISREALKSKNLDFCWIDKMISRRVSLSVSMDALKLGCWSDFKVLVPSCHIEINLGSIQLNQSSLEFGDPIACPGIRLVAIKDNDVAGMFDWVQVGTRIRREHIFAGGMRIVSESHGLDTQYPYSVGPMLEDSPRTALNICSTNGNQIAVKVADEFCAYLLFKSFSPKAVWVPMKSVVWGWTAEAEKNDAGNWELKSSSCAAPVCTDCADYPSWDRNATDFTPTMQ